VIRNRLHQTLGDFSEEEIISQIRKEKFSGEEEYLDPVDSQWKKLVTVPVFYDAFVSAALLLGSIPKGAGATNEGAGIENEPDATRLTSSSEKAEVGPQTRTENQLEQLDSMSAEERAHEATEFLPAVQKESFENYESLFEPEEKSLEKPLEERPPTAPSTQPDTELEPTKKIKNKRRVLIAVAIAAMTWALMRPDEKKLKPSPQAEKTDEANFVDSRPEDLQLYHLKCAEQAYQMDLPPGYEAALKNYQSLLEKERGKENTLGLFVKSAMAMARLIQNDPLNENLNQKFKSIVQKGRAISSQDTGFYRAEAVVHHARSEFAEAKKAQEKALETDALNPANLLVEAEWMIDQEKYEDAKTLLKSVLSWSEQSIQANYLYAIALDKTGDPEGAWRTGQNILQVNPVHAATYLLLADILSKKNDLKGAKALYLLAGKFAEIAPRKISGRAFWRAANLAELTDPSNTANANTANEAKQLYQLSYDYSDEFKERILTKTKEAPSTQDLDLARKKFLADPAYFEVLGSESRDQKNFERAEGIYLGAVWTFPREPKFLLDLAETREALARSPEEFRWAIVSYEKALQAAPNSVGGYIKLGLLETEQANYNRAFEILQRAEVLDPDGAGTQLAMGKHFFSRKDFRSAIERFRIARRINPGLSEISYYQGKLYRLFDPTDTQTAMRHFEEAYSKDPKNYEAMSEWLKLKVATFDKMFAVKFLRNMLAADPKNPNLLWVLGEVYSESQEFNKASQYYKKALDVNPQDPKVRLSLAHAFVKLGRLDEAVAEYTLSSNLNAKNGDGYFLAAGILYQGKRYKEAQELLLGLIKTLPNYPGAKRLLAMTYQATDKPDQAIEQMTQEARGNPLNYQYALELADLLYTNKKFEAAAKELGPIINLPIEKTVEDGRSPTGQKKESTGLKPYRIRGLFLLSRTLRAMNRFEAAEGAIQSAMKLEPDNLELKLERGMVYNSLGKHLEAAKDFNEVLEKNPNIPEAAQVKKIIKDTVIED